jgi:predicted glycogen debranching enzyme
MSLPNLSLTQAELLRFEDAIRKEWLITNGLGGYASSTALGINTRKYHGLLVAAVHPPGNRTVCLAKLDEELSLDNKLYLLGANEFYGAIFPQGYMFLNEFSVSPFPKFSYKVRDVSIQKTVFMPNKRNATVVIYHVFNRSSFEAKLKITPLLTCRHFHSVKNRYTNPLHFSQHQNSSNEVQLDFTFPQTSINVQSTNGEFSEKPNWIERVRYREEELRGETSTDDCYQPGSYEVFIPANSDNTFAVICAANERHQQNAETVGSIGTEISDAEKVFRQELDYRSKLLDDFYSSQTSLSASDWLSWVLLAADNFIVNGINNRKSVVAGYPWFEAWGRDTFISLPGLMLVRGKFEDARNILSDFNAFCKQGLIPNFIQDQSGQPAYNTVDATLWFVNAVLQYLKYTGDFDFVRNQLWENLKLIVENHVKGTAFGIHVDDDGLLSHGPRLTWMDAKVDGKAVTPRAGKAVEIQALWYNALWTVQLLANKFGENNLSESYAVRAEKAKTSFREKFWNNQKNCLFDVIEDAGEDDSLRPNQIIAAALDFAMLDDETNRKIVDMVQHKLVTSCGLRTLERSDPRYKGNYSGNRQSRDQAYHNGTVWPWLLGPFTTAYRKVKGSASPNAGFALQSFIVPFFTKQIQQAGLGTLSEIFDGDQPHMARGCIAQAWSVAEPLRAYVEDVMQVKPKFEKERLKV